MGTGARSGQVSGRRGTLSPGPLPGRARGVGTGARAGQVSGRRGTLSAGPSPREGEGSIWPTSRQAEMPTSQFHTAFTRPYQERNRCGRRRAYLGRHKTALASLGRASAEALNRTRVVAEGGVKWQSGQVLLFACMPARGVGAMHTSKQRRMTRNGGACSAGAPFRARRASLAPWAQRLCPCRHASVIDSRGVIGAKQDGDAPAPPRGRPEGLPCMRSGCARKRASW